MMSLLALAVAVAVNAMQLTDRGIIDRTSLMLANSCLNVLPLRIVKVHKSIQYSYIRCPYTISN